MRDQASSLPRDQSLNLVPLVVILGGMIVLFHIGAAVIGKSLIRPSHLGTALEYAHGSINLLRPVIPGFNATQTPTVLELPLWQTTVGAVLKGTGSDWYGWANLVSLIFFSLGIWPLFQIAHRYVGARAAWWAMVQFLTQPLIIVMAGKAATDGFALIVTIWFLFFADKLITTGQLRFWVPAALFAILGAITKLPFFIVAGLCSVAMLLVNRIRAWRTWLMLITAGAAALAIFLIWSNYCDQMSAQAEYPYREMRISRSPSIASWYFGDLHLRLNVGMWSKGLWRLVHGTLGSLPLATVLLAGLFAAGNRLPKLWLLAMLLTTLIFTHLVLIHWHYYLMCSAPVALLCGATLARLENVLMTNTPRQWLGVGLVGVGLVGSATEGLIAMKLGIEFDRFPAEMSTIIRQHTAPLDRLVVFKCDPEWPGELLFRADRTGFFVRTLDNSATDPTQRGLADLLDNETDLRRLKSLGYNKLVLVSESPARFAAEAVNPGSHRKREYYPASISPKVDRWAVIYRSEDLLIKEIP